MVLAGMDPVEDAMTTLKVKIQGNFKDLMSGHASEDNWDMRKQAVVQALLDSEACIIGLQDCHSQRVDPKCFPRGLIEA